MSENALLGKIRSVFLLFLTLLVFVNTIILASLLPALGHHFAPYNQEAIAACKIVVLTMEGCMSAMIISGVAYGTVKVLNWRGKRDVV